LGGVDIRVFNPQAGEIATDRTQDVVLDLQFGQTQALLVGDSHRRMEETLQREQPRANL
jgi:beta-lactamase superfamily II metal-dependent hydrolase